jgi:hypothetical protein
MGLPPVRKVLSFYRKDYAWALTCAALRALASRARASVQVCAPFEIPLHAKPHWRAIACFLSNTVTLESVEELDMALPSLSVLSDGELKEGR